MEMKVKLIGEEKRELEKFTKDMTEKHQSGEKKVKLMQKKINWSTSRAGGYNDYVQYISVFSIKI